MKEERLFKMKLFPWQKKALRAFKNKRVTAVIYPWNCSSVGVSYTDLEYKKAIDRLLAKK